MSNSELAPCPEWERWLPLTHAADLSPERRIALEAHLATCSACAAVRADYLRLDASIRAWPSGQPREGLPPALVQLWTEEGRPVPGRRPSRSMENGMRTQEENPISLPVPTRKSRPRRPGRLVTGVSAAAAVLVMAAVVLALVISHGGQLTKTGSTSSPPTSDQGWKTLPHLTNVPDEPVIAPSNPQVVYRAQMTSANPATSVTLQRSDDGGATWHTLPVPTGSTPVDSAGFIVSPLSDQRVFVQLATACTTAQSNTIAPAFAPSSGGADSCILAYLSTDGGAHWSLVHLPTHQAGSNPSLDTVTPGDIQAQGDRLYALVYAYVQDGSTFDTSFLSSTDGGATWQFADQPVVAQGNCVASYAATPAGSTVFATAADQCDPASGGAAAMHGEVAPLSGGNGPNYFLWRSDDAGAHWTRVGPYQFSGLHLSIDRAGRSVLVSAPRVPSLERGYGTGIAPQFSLDGGNTWQAGPLPHGQANSSQMLGTLSDGSIIVSFTENTTRKNHLWSWKPGDAVWHQLAGEFRGTPLYLLVLPAGSDRETLWLVTQADNTQAGSYTAQRVTV